MTDSAQLRTFFILEIDDASKKDLLKKINDAIVNRMGTMEIFFNMYSITVYPTANKIKLSNDIDADTPEEELILSHFLSSLEKWTPQHGR